MPGSERSSEEGLGSRIPDPGSGTLRVIDRFDSCRMPFPTNPEDRHDFHRGTVRPATLAPVRSAAGKNSGRSTWSSGPSRCGKTEFGNALAQCLNTRAMDTSALLIDHLIALEMACPVNIFDAAEWRERIGIHKDFYRPKLVILGNMICDARPSKLLEECEARADVIMGARRMAEIEAWLRLPGRRRPDHPHSSPRHQRRPRNFQCIYLWPVSLVLQQRQPRRPAPRRR